MTGADAMVKCLELERVEYVFGYPGVAICPFYDSILKTEIRTVLVRTEQSAAHAANGYARISGRAGVAAVTSGPGATNVITGIATAFADSIPIVVITGQVDSQLLGSDVFQEADISGACESFVKYSYIVRNAEEIPRIMREAFYLANSGRKGPVLIDVPVDVQKAELKSFSYPREHRMRTYRPTVEGNTVQIKKVFHRLREAKRPILCVGGGIFLAGAAQKLRAFAKKQGLPVVSTMMGIGAMESSDPLYFGMVGNNGKSCGNRAMNEADMIIMAGARAADRSISQPGLITENKTFVHIDVDPAEIGKNAGPEIPLVGDLSSVFDKFLEQEGGEGYGDWLSLLSDYRREEEEREEERLQKRLRLSDLPSPELLLRELSLKMQEDGIYIADVGQNQLWSCGSYKMRGGRFLTSGGMGTMGYSIPASIGAKLAAPKRQVVSVIGDGGFQMCMMELATLRQYGIAVKILVLKNQTLGLVRQYQHFVLGDRYSMTELGSDPELSKLSEAYHLRYLSIRKNEEISEKLSDFLGGEDSALLECVIDPDEVAR